MRKILVCLIMMTAGAWVSFAKPPVRYMSKYTLGVEYSAAFRGQFITRQKVNALERMHVFKAHYSPIEYVQFYIGAGADRFEVRYEEGNKHFEGNYGFSPSIGFSINSPALLRDILRVTANIDMLYLNSKDKHDYKYSGAILDPSLGIIAQAGPIIDVEAGVRGHFIAGTMKVPGNNGEYNFSNYNNVRGYFNFTLCSPQGAYAQFNFDASQGVQKDFEEGPVEMTLGFSIGVLIASDLTNKQLRERSRKYFPEFEDMKDREEKMEEKIEE